VKRLEDLEKENERLRKAVSDLTLETLIRKGEAWPNASGNRRGRSKRHVTLRTAVAAASNTS